MLLEVTDDQIPIGCMQPTVHHGVANNILMGNWEQLVLEHTTTLSASSKRLLENVGDCTIMLAAFESMFDGKEGHYSGWTLPIVGVLATFSSPSNLDSTNPIAGQVQLKAKTLLTEFVGWLMDRQDTGSV